EERQDVSEAAVRPHRPVHAEHQVHHDIDSRDDRENGEHELGVLAWYFGVEPQEERRGVGERHHEHIEHHGADGARVVAAEEVRPNRREHFHRAPLPRKTVTAVFRRIPRSVSTEWSCTYWRS